MVERERAILLVGDILLHVVRVCVWGLKGRPDLWRPDNEQGIL